MYVYMGSPSMGTCTYIHTSTTVPVNSSTPVHWQEELYRGVERVEKVERESSPFPHLFPCYYPKCILMSERHAVVSTIK